ncbi:MAG: hypothetical protein IJ396_04650 [Oscillibacter sp.]|nr:hypothetical protein [Oscillibacter sp.]
MKTMKYTVIVQSALGPRAGELKLTVYEKRVSGNFSLLGAQNALTGQELQPDKYLISGMLTAGVGKEPYDGIVTLKGGKLLGGLFTPHGCWDMTGVQIGE